MEQVAISVAKSLTSVIQVASKFIAEEIGLLLGVEEELFFIQEELEMMGSFLRAASAENVKNDTVITWIKQVRELAFDVEDCLQEASVYLMQKSCLPAWCSVKERDYIARKIRMLKARIENVSKRNLRYELLKSSGVAEGNNDPIDHKGTSPWLSANDEPFLVGLDEPMEKLVGLIKQNSTELKVISVVGMSGLGKTTLARKVCTVKDLSDDFMFAWVNVLHPFNMEEFIESLAKQILLHTEDVMQGPKSEDQLFKKTRNEKMAEKKVTDKLKEKKYVIVLDDLSLQSEWDKIKPVLPESTGSRIIVTTQSEDLAKSISVGSNIYNIDRLSSDDAEYLLYKTVFKTSNTKDQPNESGCDVKTKLKQFKKTITSTSDMEQQAQKIIKMCDGLPIAIVTVGSYLATLEKKYKSDEWKKVHDQFDREIKDNPRLEKVKTILNSSYGRLPYHLKSCLLNLSIFHNHHDIRRTRIIRRWMADGYVMGDHDKTPEEVGKDYFNDLMGRSLIQPSRRVSGDIYRCNIHDIMYKLILEKSMKENDVSVLKDENLVTMTDKIRHMVITGGQRKKDSVLTKLKFSHLRSLSIFGEVGDNLRYINRMKLLRVLDLEGIIDLGNQDLKKVGELRHLKYLGLRGTKITKLTKSLRKLHELETLDIRNTAVVRLPKEFTELQNLSYLRAGFDLYKEDLRENTYPMCCNVLCSLWFQCLVWPITKLEYCSNCTPMSDKAVNYLKSCCPNICMALLVLFCLPILDRAVIEKNYGTNGVRVPPGMRKLRSLHTVGMVDVCGSERLIKEMQYLTNLRKLAVTGFSEKNGETLAEVINGLNHLVSLVLSATDKRGLKRCLDSVSSSFPPKYLKSLKLYSPISELPGWIEKLENLEKMELRYTELWMEEIKKIEKLQNLTVLRISANSIEQRNISSSSANSVQEGNTSSSSANPIEERDICLSFRKETFPNLKALIIERMGFLVSVSFEERSMPKLENLEINRCYSLGQGGLSGLHLLKQLKEILVKYGEFEETKKKELISELETQISTLPNKPRLRGMRY
ncbi:Disease resistance protein RPM1 [Rhynchospora pubera]|uniref:Disease resistance protein RPM1 n=1 Tax=Rhynchospora pubera TaxID=906938 RepID=A0AAV8CQY9_9POAL|nr:Disease resistance protein RPM1 [Rhynchospora pubera]